jgi:hypothetical protein
VKENRKEGIIIVVCSRAVKETRRLILGDKEKTLGKK